jgi:hypothetical protein
MSDQLPLTARDVSSRTKMKRKKRTPEERAADEARYQSLQRRLRERMEYWRTRAEQEEAERS